MSRTEPDRPDRGPWESCAVDGPIVDFPRDARIEDFLRERARGHPHQIAVTSPAGTLTYAELASKVNRLARTLRANGVRPDDRVAVAVPRSPDMLVAILATLTAGAAYVPIDLSYPASRIAYLLADCAPTLVLGRPDAFPADLAAPVIDPHDESAYSADDGPLERLGDATNLAYVIYTSGSTGAPKGVMVEHRSVVNRLHWMQRAYPITSADVILQKTPVAFDVSVWELFWWLLVGASVHLLEPGGERDPERIVAAIGARSVTTVHFVPSMLHALLSYVDATGRPERLAGLRRVFASGEALTPHQVRWFHRLVRPATDAVLVNLYGPTEATVDVTHFVCAEPNPELVPLGAPIDNTRIYVLDPELKPTARGEAGELCLAGVGLARGYLGRERLTEQRFVTDPFPGEPRIYRTGDLVRLGPDDTVEYLGRNDHQVKIRGVRIELGEVEAALLRHPSVTAAVAVARPSPAGENQLCGYVVASIPVAPADLRAHVAALVPPAAVPAHLVVLEAFPLTANGKLDRAALPAPEITPANDVADTPRSPAEHALAAAWAAALAIPAERIGRTDNFFDLGGTSLAVMRVTTELRGLLTVGDLMRQSDLAPLALVLAERQAGTAEHTEGSRP